MPLTKTQIIQAITERMKRGFTDGYCYYPDEWRLLKVKEVDRQTTLGRIHAYYALVEIFTPNPENAICSDARRLGLATLSQQRFSIAVFEVDEGEETIVIGDDEAYFPDDAVDFEF